MLRLTNSPGQESGASWSPDGSRILFSSRRTGNWDLFAIDPIGGGVANLTSSPEDELAAQWSPTGDRLLFFRRGAGSYSDVYVANAAGSGLVNISNAPSLFYTFGWSPDGARVVYGTTDTMYVIGSDGTARQLFRSGCTFAYTPDWQPLPANTPSSHARPKGATPIYASLVPAMRPCAAPTKSHAPPLSFGACAPPVPWSANLTLGGDTTAASSIGSLQLHGDVDTPGNALLATQGVFTP